MKRKTRRKALRTKIVAWSFVPTGIILFVVAIVTFLAFQKTTEQSALEQDLGVTYLAANQISAEIQSSLDILVALAYIPDLAHDDPRIQEEALWQAEEIFSMSETENEGFGLILVDSQGEVIAATSGQQVSPGADWSNRDVYHDVLELLTSGEPIHPVLSNVVNDGMDNTDVIVAAMPVLSTENKFRGILLLTVPIQSIDELEIIASEEIDPLLAIMVDGNGRVIYHPAPSYLGADFSDQEAVKRALAGELGAMRTRDVDGQLIVAGYAPIPNTPWSLITEISWKELHSQSKVYRYFLSFLLLLGVIVPTFIVSMGVKKITAPLTHLMNAVEDAASGHFSQITTINTGDEIEELAHQFNAMAAQLQASYTNLEQKVADRTEELRESETRYRELFNRSPIGIYRTNPDGTIMDANPTLLQLLGFSSIEEGNQVGLLNLYADPDDRQQLLAQVREGPVSNFETRFRRKDGNIIFVSIRATLTYDKEGRPEFLQGTLVDITERKRAEQALYESRERLQLAIEGAGLGLWDLNLLTGEQVMNYDWWQALGYESRERISNFDDIAQLVHPDDSGKMADAFNDHLSGTASPFEVEFRVQAKSGLWVWVLFRGKVVAYDAQGKPLRMAGISQNITAQKQAEEELRRAKEAAEEAQCAAEEAQCAAEEAQRAAEAANRAKSVFLANMSHELRTPLNAILGFTQLMGRDPHLTPPQRENLDTISRSGQHLLTLINDVLEMSKIEAGRSHLFPENFDLHRLLEALEDMFYLRATEKGLQLLLERAPDVPHYVRTDESKLRQVLINLLSNAIKFTDEGGITVRVRQVALDVEGQATQPLPPAAVRLQFEVEDTGVGIVPEELSALFDPFVQTASGQESKEGTGLGLPISQEYVRLMGGEITVSSTVGHGSVFQFEIQAVPVDTSEVKVEPSKGHVIGLAPGQPIYRLLIAEDKWTNRQLLVKILEPLGFEIREAINGKQAIEIWEQWEPHLIWMDMRMPVMDGHEATKHIKATTRGQATVIVALTASAFEEDRKLILSEGCDDFVRKPFREAELFDVLSRNLGIRFIYAEQEHPAVGRSEKDTETFVTPEVLATLPPAWVTALHDAAVAADTDQITELVEQIREQTPSLAAALTDLVYAFRFDVIMKLTEAVRDGSEIG